MRIERLKPNQNDIATTLIERNVIANITPAWISSAKKHKTIRASKNNDINKLNF